MALAIATVVARDVGLNHARVAGVDDAEVLDVTRVDEGG
jgi:hypothetical protein